MSKSLEEYEQNGVVVDPVFVILTYVTDDKRVLMAIGQLLPENRIYKRITLWSQDHVKIGETMRKLMDV